MLPSYQRIALFGVLIVSIGAGFNGNNSDRTDRQFRIYGRLGTTSLPNNHRTNYEYDELEKIDSPLNPLRTKLSDRGVAIRRLRKPSRGDGVKNVTNNSSSPLTKIVQLSMNGKHGGKKKKKIVDAILHVVTELMWSVALKFVPDFTKLDMLVLGMLLHAKFHAFVMHALVVSKMALISVVMMIMREPASGSKNQPPSVKVNVTHQRHPHPHPHPHHPHRHHHHHHHQRHTLGPHHHHRLTQLTYKYPEPEMPDGFDYVV